MEAETHESTPTEAPPLPPTPAPVLESAPAEVATETPTESPGDASTAAEPAPAPPSPPPAPTPPVEKPAEKPAEPAAPAPAPAADTTTSTSEFRTWTDDTGRYSTRAQLVSVSADVVHLLKSDGQCCNVPRERLSQADRQYVGTIQAIAGVR